LAKKNNYDIRLAIKNATIFTWEVSNRLGIHENTFYRMLRKELPASKKKTIYEIINELEKEAQDLKGVR
jgi:transposase